MTNEGPGLRVFLRGRYSPDEAYYLRLAEVIGQSLRYLARYGDRFSLQADDDLAELAALRGEALRRADEGLRAEEEQRQREAARVEAVLYRHAPTQRIRGILSTLYRDARQTHVSLDDAGRLFDRTAVLVGETTRISRDVADVHDPGIVVGFHWGSPWWVEMLYSHLDAAALGVVVGTLKGWCAIDLEIKLKRTQKRAEIENALEALEEDRARRRNLPRPPSLYPWVVDRVEIAEEGDRPDES
jgi:hypothetical protein